MKLKADGDITEFTAENTLTKRPKNQSHKPKTTETGHKTPTSRKPQLLKVVKERCLKMLHKKYSSVFGLSV